jgi:hypothetical protein
MPDTFDYRDAPTYWFAVLEIAREKGDYDRAAEAQRELARLGVQVRYQKPKAASRKVVVHDQ